MKYMLILRVDEIMRVGRTLAFERFEDAEYVQKGIQMARISETKISPVG